MEDVTLVQLFAQMDRHLARQDEILAKMDERLAAQSQILARQTEILEKMDQRTVLIQDSMERTNQYQHRTSQLLLEHGLMLDRLFERLATLQRP